MFKEDKINGGKGSGVIMCTRKYHFLAKKCRKKVSIWSQKGKRTGSVMVGVYYRLQEEEGREVGFQARAKVSTGHGQVVMGDFNYPDVCWTRNRAGHR